MKRLTLMLSSLVLLSFPAHAAEKGYDATYDVFAGGLHTLQARLIYRENNGKYSVSVESETYGLLGKLVPWKGSFRTKGWTEKTRRQPETHISASVYKGDTDEKIFKYAKGGKFISYTKSEEGKIQPPSKELDLAIAQGSKDILSTTLEVLDRLATDDSCAHGRKIFDGERSFQMNFTPHGTDNFKKSDYNIYAGQAVSCTVEVIPDKGKWHKKPRGWLSIQEQGRKKGTLPTLWFAPMASLNNQPAVPVKIMLKTDYGTFMIHMTSFAEKGAK